MSDNPNFNPGDSVKVEKVWVENGVRYESTRHGKVIRNLPSGQVEVRLANFGSVDTFVMERSEVELK